MKATWDDSDESGSESENEDVANFCFMAHSDKEDEQDDEVCLKASKKSKWYLDSGCSRHMTGDQSKFVTFSKKDGDFVTFSDNKKGKIIGKGSIGNESSILIEDVLLVDGLKHDLLSISQLCDKGFRVVFDKKNCIIENASDRKVLFVGNRDENVYTIDLNDYPISDKCLSVLHDDSWLWHRRLGHASMHLISNISKNSLVRGLPKFKFEKDKVCDACQMVSTM
ncbi:uncharacterized protein LOC111022973 [Momordica charantia]|uniref:Uncharacterized protein LOC111022973 n=1 Tax=Momordica charantia TaxID=3673 RepID=A0A6J1DPE4_MOMCH|nr:uncharacterized protein LOC111022973 [Momordica charantia]